IPPRAITRIASPTTISTSDNPPSRRSHRPPSRLAPARPIRRRIVCTRYRWYAPRIIADVIRATGWPPPWKNTSTVTQRNRSSCVRFASFVQSGAYPGCPTHPPPRVHSTDQQGSSRSSCPGAAATAWSFSRTRPLYAPGTAQDDRAGVGIAEGGDGHHVAAEGRTDQIHAGREGARRAGVIRPRTAAAPAGSRPHTPGQVLDHVGLRGRGEKRPPAAPLRPGPLLHPAHLGAQVARRAGQPAVVDQTASGESQSEDDGEDGEGDDGFHQGETVQRAMRSGVRVRAAGRVIRPHCAVSSSQSGRS